MKNKVFESVQNCITILSQMVPLFRKQFFYEANKKLISLNKQLNEISSFLTTQGGSSVDTSEWTEILLALVEAQGNQDYILLADILEGDLLPYLQKFQMVLQTEFQIELPDYLDENLKCIEEIDAKLYRRIVDNFSKDASDENLLEYEVGLAVNGLPTIKVNINDKRFYLHSSLDPKREGEILAENMPKSASGKYVILGLNMGYHISALLDKDMKNSVEVLEHKRDILCMALSYFDWREHIKSGRLKIIYEPDTVCLMQYITQSGDKMFYTTAQTIRCVDNSAVRVALEDYFTPFINMQEQSDHMESNFEYLQNMNLPECEELKHVFEGKRVVIAAGGPSLDSEIESIKEYREKFSIISVGTVARKLMQNGIIPDVIIITDLHDILYKQVEGLDAAEIPLMLLSTASQKVPQYYNGPMYLVYQSGYEPAEEVALKSGYKMFQTGGSVTTTALDVCIRLGADEIILVGADMAYTNNFSHASGIGQEITDTSGLRSVPSVQGGMVYTSKSLDMYRKWIERRISGLKFPKVYNTSKGARIAGTIETSIEKLMK